MSAARAIARPTPAPLDIERARDLIAKSTSVDELVDMRSKAKAVEVYQRAQRAGLETAARASCIVVEAERRIGSLLAASPKAKGGAAKGVGRRGKNAVPAEDRIPETTIRDLGISKNDSSRFQKLAAIPETPFKETVEAHRVLKKPITARAIIAAHAPAREAKPPPPAPVAAPVVESPASGGAVAAAHAAADRLSGEDQRTFLIEAIAAMDEVARAGVLARLAPTLLGAEVARLFVKLTPEHRDEVLVWMTGRVRGVYAPKQAPRFVEAREGPTVPKYYSRWTPRHVYTLHHVPGSPAGSPPLCVRRRFLSDGCNIGDPRGVEIARHPVDLYADDLEEHGCVRTDGDIDEGPDASPPRPPRAEPVVMVYDHEPTPDERVEWLACRAREQAFIRNAPEHLWVSTPAAKLGAPDVAVACSYERALGRVYGDATRGTVRVRLPGFNPDYLNSDDYWKHVDVDLYKLVQSPQGYVSIERPTADQLAEHGRQRANDDRRARRAAAAKKRRLEAVQADAAGGGSMGSAFGFAFKFVNEDRAIDVAFEHLGLDRGAASRDIKARYRVLARDEHPDRGGDAAAFRKTTEAYELALEHAEAAP